MVENSNRRPGPETASRPLGMWRDFAANYAGTGTAMLLGLLLAPLYVRLIGSEGYGLIGFYLSVSVLCSVFDLGLSTTVNRRLATNSPESPARPSNRELLRGVEAVYWSIGLGLGVAVWAAAPWIADHWIHARSLTSEAIRHTVQWMGVAIALQWPSQLYIAALLGLQHHIRLNALRTVFASLQAFGAVWILTSIAPTPAAYFAWYAATYALFVATLARVTWGSLGPAITAPRLRLGKLREHAGFAAGLTGITATSIVLTQVDKLIISKTMPLDSLGLYTLSSMVSAGVGFLALPISATLFPTLASEAAANCTKRLATAYHLGCQLTALIVVPVACCIVAFAHVLLPIWTSDPSIASQTASVVRVLVIGSMLNALTLMAYQLQIAHGWTSLSLTKNLIAIVVVIPLMLVMVRSHGLIGAATVWLALNLGYVLFEIPTMHRRLLVGHAQRWYRADVIAPLVASATVTGIAAAFMPEDLQVVGSLLWIIGTYALAIVVAVASLPGLRKTGLTSISKSRRGTFLDWRPK